MIAFLPRSLSALTLGAALLSAPVARAANYSEVGDAGDLPATAQVVAGPAGTPLDRVTGRLTLTSGISDGDLFQIYISNPTAFSASTTGFVAGANNFDTQLFLFDSTGRGVYANDDSPSGGSQSTLTANSGFVTTVGTYFLLVDGSGRYPVDTLGRLIFPNFTDNTTDQTDVVGATGPGGAAPVAGFTGNSNEAGNYSIALTGAQFIVVPEPSTLVAVGSGLGLLALARRRRR